MSGVQRFSSAAFSAYDGLSAAKPFKRLSRADAKLASYFKNNATK
jgi:hypothetical protein